MKTSILKRLFLFLILFSLTLGLTGCQNTEQTKSVQSFISGVCQEFCVNRFNKQHRIAA
jgi:uncharacterized lipoprotein YehR (DUF1307 family)